ncbi:hypothetical protein GGI00_003289 [Coemansia sp. RSA 2681]|nr:hypothetical protein GGI00_003289 [Coemansia sp. RSA 2681]
MQLFPVFQLLPPHVVEKIVNHVAGSSRLHYDGIYNNMEEYRLLQMPLLWVCHNFRAVVHARFCRKYGICLYEPGRELDSWHYSWPQRRRKLGYPTHHLAKGLTIGINTRDIFTGQALRQLSMAPYEGCAFPLVRTLSFQLSAHVEGGAYTTGYGDDNYSTERLKGYPPGTGANIAALVRRLKEMVPAARDVIMICNTEKSLQRGDKHMVDLVQQLFDLAEKHTTINYAIFRIAYYVDLTPISNIVNIRCSVRDKPDPMLALARRCAQTLQTLDIHDGCASAMSRFIQDPDSGAYAEYPRLQILIINTFAAYVTSLRPVFNGAVPFPSLCRLRIDSDYPFDDDVAFRGNSATLESLRLALQPATVAMLKKYSFVLSIAPDAAVRAMDGPSVFDEDHPQALSVLGKHASIQVLVLHNVSLTFCDAINLIKSLPLLSDLHTAVPTFDGLGQGIDMAELPDYVRSTYAPVGQRFRCWRIDHKEEIDYEELATFVLLLALVCPSFDYFAVSKDNREPFMEVVEEMITEPEFIHYAPRLRRLLFGGWYG